MEARDRAPARKRPHHAGYRLVRLSDIVRRPPRTLARAVAVKWAPFGTVLRPTFRWWYDRRALALYLGDPMTGLWCYYVDLERCTASAQLCDWIFQIAKKTWASPRVLAELVRALNDVLNPQGSLCSCGVERGPLDVVRFLRNHEAMWGITTRPARREATR